jgi:hypothetical protein
VIRRPTKASGSQKSKKEAALLIEKATSERRGRLEGRRKSDLPRRNLEKATVQFALGSYRIDRSLSRIRIGGPQVIGDFESDRDHAVITGFLLFATGWTASFRFFQLGTWVFADK